MEPRELPDRVAEIITRYSMILAGGRVGVAVSGGADSVVLLYLLSRASASLDVSLAVLHVNHQLRGDESEADEEFVRKLSGSLALPFFAERTTLGDGNLEELAREARRSFFRKMRNELQLDRIALGHTRSDQAETVLFRFLRGSGISGLAGMEFVSQKDGLIRPLLAEGREEVRLWAQANGLRWREDSSNSDVHFRRNRLRLETIPALEAQYNPNLEAVLAGAAAVAQAENDFWEETLAATYDQVVVPTPLGLSIETAALGQLHVAVQRRLIRRAIRELRGHLRSIDVEHVEAVLRVCRSGHGHDRVMLPGVDAMRSFGTLLLAEPGQLSQPRNYHLPLELGQSQELPYQAGRLCLDPVNSDLHFYANFKEEQNFLTERADLEWGALAASGSLSHLAVRNWQPGDAMERPGRGRPEKLKELFQQYRVPLWTRRHWPVLVAGTKIVWTRKFGCAAGYERRTGPPWIRLTYKEEGNARI